MKHATAGALDQIEPLLEPLRTLPGLRERSRGVFYYRSKAFLHFHEDPTSLYADVRLSGADFDRLKVDTEAERQALLTAAAEVLTG